MVSIAPRFTLTKMEIEAINWNIFENFIGEKLPACIKSILNLCGYNTFLSLREIKQRDITEIEECVKKNFSTQILQLHCCHAEYYISKISHAQFKLLPGHETLIMALPKYAEKLQKTYLKQITDLKGRYSFILNELIQTAEENRFNDIHHTIYSDEIRSFAVYVFLLCGRACYKMLKANLPIPSIPTIRKFEKQYHVMISLWHIKSEYNHTYFLKHIVRYVNENKSRILEGQIRSKELFEYLTKMNCTKHVWLSEDATAITAKVTYDPKTNQLIGLVLPIDYQTGCPKYFTYVALNAECIQEYLMLQKSSVVYVVMAQPVDERVPPFVLQMFGSDNRFKTTDVVKRWKHTRNELEK